MDLSLEVLRAANILRDGEWDPEGKIDLSFRMVELAGEVGELANVVKKLRRAELGLPGSRTTAEQLADELADVIICADLLGMKLGIDLSEAVRRKFNATSEKVGFTTKLG